MAVLVIPLNNFSYKSEFIFPIMSHVSFCRSTSSWLPLCQEEAIVLISDSGVIKVNDGEVMFRETYGAVVDACRIYFHRHECARKGAGGHVSPACTALTQV